MTDIIGTLHSERLACGDHHLPGCYNPNDRACTACICGEMWWPGQVGTWHSRQIRESDVVPEHGRPRPGAVTGWDVYFLHAPGCRQRKVTPALSHTCGDAAPVTAAEFWQAAS